MAEEDVIMSCLNLMRRMPPDNVQKDLCGLLNLAPFATEEILQRVDQPLQEAVDPANGRKYLLCDYNRDGDSYRSPWSNTYDPPIEDGFVPSDYLRRLEIQANEIFNAYREMYYQGGVSSVYMWDLDPGFAACFLIKKDVKTQRFVNKGSWHSIHVVEVQETSKTQATYKLTTTVMLSMDINRKELGTTNLSGTLTRQSEKTREIEEGQDGTGHITNIGKMIEDMEIELRSNLDVLYIGKTREVVNGIRSVSNEPKQTSIFVGELSGAIERRGNTK